MKRKPNRQNVEGEDSNRAENILPSTDTARSLHSSAANLAGAGNYAPPPADDNIFLPLEETRDSIIPKELFDEAGYLRLNPDVQRAVQLGTLKSGYSHYLIHGHSESRIVPDFPRESRNVMLPSLDAQPHEGTASPIRCAIDALIIAPGRGMMVVGWIDDSKYPLNCLRLVGSDWRVVIDASQLVRLRRTDAETALESRARHSFGFFGFLHFERGGDSSGTVRVEFWQSGGYSVTMECSAATVDDSELRNAALAYLAQASFFGNRNIEAITAFGRGTGNELVQFNRAITRRILTKPYSQRFGPLRHTFRGTIVVCLYGKSEFYFLQNCLFGGLPGIDDYEFIYVCNSPELAESLLNEAHSASRTYGLANTILILPGNAGFGGANNIASQFASTDRLLLINPDVFPRDRDWAQKHTRLLEEAQPEQTRLFGVPLYYDDGSLMHGGLFFETDIALSLSSGTSIPHRICRVEHYGKGMPSESRQFTRPRAVPAVTGAFISVDREWFEQLGGFTEDFIYGHYEDADLCLKSLARGTAPWLQDIRMWHLEGKGSTHQLSHQGGALINRWLFTERWLSFIEDGLNGAAPTHPLVVNKTEVLAASPITHGKRKASRGSGGAS